MYDAASGRQVLEAVYTELSRISSRWSPDGSQLITTSDEDGTARMWDAETGEMCILLTGLTQAWGPAGRPAGNTQPWWALMAVCASGIRSPVLNCRKYRHFGSPILLSGHPPKSGFTLLVKDSTMSGVQVILSAGECSRDARVLQPVPAGRRMGGSSAAGILTARWWSGMLKPWSRD